ncbi:hypothetical protein CBR_g28828 [Chara braunii]|uniref:GTP-binding nuclear protein n=1 Tax=Chara braunii TaxID=69332 RepID=A0A388LAA0_CHABU|nr:hypothetical protein CBR_g28828 [Chara braunii]|eukprot:GBG79113.1 hypothetical protein CBR_g28828 [Chara braunii]
MASLVSSQPPTEQIPSFKLILVGDGGAGKTTFLKRHLTGEFEELYEPTIGVQVRPLLFVTNRGRILFNCWDTSGQEKVGGLRDAYYVHGSCAIIMFDVTCKSSYKNVSRWYEDICRVCDLRIPMVLCGNKVDVNKRQVKPHHVTFHKTKANLDYCEMSAKGNYNVDKPFLYLARKLLDDPDIVFLQGPAMEAPEVEMTDIDQQQKQYETEIAAAGHGSNPTTDR